MTETWATVPGFDGYYEASDKGRIRSIDRFVNRNGHKMHRIGQIMTPRTMPNGYQTVMLRKDGVAKRSYVHRVIAMTFLGTPYGMEVNHINENKTDNRLSNLEWLTRSDNLKHNGGSKRRVAKRRIPVIVMFDDVPVRYESYAEAAAAINAPVSSIYQCCKHIKGINRVHGHVVMTENEWGMKPIVDEEADDAQA